MAPRELNLIPPLFEAGNLDDFLESGETISFSLSPRSNSLAVFAAPLQSISSSNSYGSDMQEQDVYTMTLDRPPSGERRVFITDTSVIFVACMKIVDTLDHSDIYKTELTFEDLATFRKLANDYILHIHDNWIHSMQIVSGDGDSESTRNSGDHYRSMFTTFSLFQILYLPEDGIDDVPVGDELLEWLNTHYIEPSTEEGNRLSGHEHPWEDDIFWPYLIRATVRGLIKSSTFFLRSLFDHPSENLQRVARRLVALLEKHPRQRNFSTEREFLTTSRRWKDKVKALRIELDRVPERDRSDGFENWWENISDMLGVLEGREDILQRICIELGGGWKEIICVYGVWVNVSLRRADLPEICRKVLMDLPPDPTDKEDMLHSELIQGRPTHALAIAHEMDPWLAAHLVDIMASIRLIDSDADEETGMSIRDQYVLSYADYLHSDPGLWRLTVDYLCTCGEIGKEMADEVLIRVPLNIRGSLSAKEKPQEKDPSASMEVEEEMQDEDEDISGIVKELNATCYEYSREHARRMICQIAAQELVELKKYGLAVSYCRSAEDWTMLGRIVDSIMEEYIIHGPSHYVQLVADVAPSLQELRAETSSHGVFVHRLMFAIRYAEFHQRQMLDDLGNAAMDLLSLFEEELAPRAWWGVLLYDAIPFLHDDRNMDISTDAACLLLRRLEEITLRASQGCGDDYLGILARILHVGSSKQALGRLGVLRLALARYLARCTLVGGTSPNEF